MSTFSTSLQYVILTYFFMFICFYFSAKYIIFQPPRPATYRDNADVIKIKTKNNHQISAVYLRNPDAKYTILFSHGNAGDLGSFYPIIQMYQQHGFSIFAYDYSGYGTSTGEPSENNTYDDIISAYQYLTQILKVNPDNILIYGQSVGSGPSIELALHYPAKALILESPFISAFRVITHIPLFPFDKYQNLNKITKINMPIFIIHGTHDTVVPNWHGRKIFSTIQGEKRAYWVRNADHNNLHFIAGQEYWGELGQFIRQLEK